MGPVDRHPRLCTFREHLHEHSEIEPVVTLVGAHLIVDLHSGVGLVHVTRDELAGGAVCGDAPHTAHRAASRIEWRERQCRLQCADHIEGLAPSHIPPHEGLKLRLLQQRRLEAPYLLK